jgi:hypothetical protein
VAKQKQKDKKAAEEKARQAVHARATAEVLAKQAAAHAVAMLKGEVVTQFTADQFWVHMQLRVVGGRLAAPCFASPVFDARAAIAGGAVHDGRWRVPARHRP